MQRGRIKIYKQDKGFGYIVPDEGYKDIFFHISVVENPKKILLEQGVIVLFEPIKTEKGLSAKKVIIEPPYRFFNPYNFARFLEIPHQSGGMEKTITNPLAHAFAKVGFEMGVYVPGQGVLGKCAGPPHDRWVGYSGRIKCLLEPVTPLFVSDSEEVKDEGKGHKSYRFFRLGDRPAIPAASLRGMLRSIYETATNSCFIMSDAERRLSYRMDANNSLSLTPARVEYNDGTWHLRLLPGTSAMGPGENAVDILPAAWVFRYPRGRSADKGSATQRGVVDIPDGMKHGSHCWAVMVETEHHTKRFKFWNVVKLFPSEKEANTFLPTVTIQKKKCAEEGWLYISGKNIERKHDEKFFFRIGNTKLPEFIEFDGQKRKEYRELLEQYLKNKKDSTGRSAIENSHFIKDAEKIKDAPRGGDLVYVKLAGTIEEPVVEFVVPVAVSRLQYAKALREFIPGSLHGCDGIDELCPACRIFGWVKKEVGKDKKEKRQGGKRASKSGRLRFTNAEMISGDPVFKEIALNVLSQPKPTTGYFYLWPQKKESLDMIFKEGYNAEAWIRGRKIYRHHGNVNPKEYESTDYNQDEQSRTLREVIMPSEEPDKKAVFAFEMHFENLSEIELGALLWSLSMDGMCYHRLGYAKPFGFGSVNISVQEVKILDSVQRYTQLGLSGYRDYDKSQQEQSIKSFKDEMVKMYDCKSFHDLPNIADILALLSINGSALPVHYPRPQRDLPSRKGREERDYVKMLHFNWFIGNKKIKLRNGTTRQRYYPLRASEDKRGMGLVNRDGYPVD